LDLEDALQRHHNLREIFNSLHGLACSGAEWRILPYIPLQGGCLPADVHLLAAGVFAAIVHNLRMLLCLADWRKGQPSEAILDSLTLPSTSDSSGHADHDGQGRRRGWKAYAAVDTLGHLLALHITPPDAQDRAQVEALAAAVQEATG
jgi:transposase